MSAKTNASGETPRCSFCHKSKDDVAYLIAFPTDDPRAYICDERVSFCHATLNKPQTDPSE
jgi:ATP-dependent Clp protease ATP-binding subunit ClpX